MQVISLYITSILIWGTTWIAISFQLGDIATEVSLAYRFAIASTILFIYCWLKKLNLRFNKQQHIRFFGIAMTMFGFNFYLLYSGQHLLNSALAAIAFATLVVMNIINSRLFLNSKVSSQEVLGALLGLVGICVLFWPELNSQNLNSEAIVGLGLCLLGTYVASLSNMLSVSNQRQKLPIVQTNAWAMAYGAATMALLAMVKGSPFVVDLPLTYWLSMGYLSLFGSIIAFGCYLSLLDKIGASKTSYITVITPAFAVVIGAMFEGFVLNNFIVGGICLILLGNIVVLYKRKPKTKVIVSQNPQTNSI